MIEEIETQVNATLWLIGQGNRTEAEIEALYNRLGKTCVALVTQSLPEKKKYPAKDPAKEREYNTGYQRKRRALKALESQGN